MEKTSINTNVKELSDVQRSLESIKNELDKLKEKLEVTPEEVEDETVGQVGSIRIIKNSDTESLFEIKDNEGWKKPMMGESQITLRKLTTNIKTPEKKSIDEIETEDTNTDSDIAKKTLYDEKAEKFILPRPDYDSGWTLDGTSALTHSLGTEAIKLIQVSYNNAQDDTTSTIYNTNDAGGSSPTAVVVTNGINAITATISNGLNYYKVRLWK